MSTFSGCDPTELPRPLARRQRVRDRLSSVPGRPRTGHLTARACGEIAVAADVAALLPFHFSRRYQTEPERVYAEIRAVFPRLVERRRDSSARPCLQPRPE